MRRLGEREEAQLSLFGALNNLPVRAEDNVLAADLYTPGRDPKTWLLTEDGAIQRLGAFPEPKAVVERPARPNLRLLLALLALFNLADLAFTRQALALGATEVNPILAPLFELDFLVGAGLKLALAAAGIYALWRLRQHPLARTGAILATAVYGFLLLYHLALQSLIV